VVSEERLSAPQAAAANEVEEHHYGVELESTDDHTDDHQQFGCR
jgi:hypothetical protein